MNILSNLKNWRKPGGHRKIDFDFARAAKPDAARRLYEYFVKCLAEKGVAVKTGVFAAHMTVEIINDGPVTIWLDSRGAGDKARQAPPDGGLPPERP